MNTKKSGRVEYLFRQPGANRAGLFLCLRTALAALRGSARELRTLAPALPSARAAAAAELADRAIRALPEHATALPEGMTVRNGLVEQIREESTLSNSEPVTTGDFQALEIEEGDDPRDRIRRGKLPKVNLEEFGLTFDEKARPEYPPDYIMAGKGCKTGRRIDDIKRLVEEYKGFHADARNWSKQKARYEVVDEYGQIRQIEVHWYYHPNVGKCEDKIKFDEHGNYFVDLWE